MRRASLYSSSRRPRNQRSSTESSSLSDAAPTDRQSPPEVGSAALPAASAGIPPRPSTGSAARDRAGNIVAETAPSASASSVPSRPAWRQRLARIGAPAAGIVAGALLVLALQGGVGTPAQQITQEDIDAAVLNTLETQQLPSQAARAARVIGPSVVRVLAYGPEDASAGAEADKPEKPDRAERQRQKVPKDAAREVEKSEKEAPKEVQKGVGTGVVIKDSGLILTNLHVVGGAQRLKVVFWDGSESEAAVTGARPEHDLAVLQAATLPDDLQPATLRSTGDLAEGDGVVAVGFPFDIGPSVSSGVISGFGREYRSTSGERILTNLIQFDAAANPGNSGGPLVTMDGEVVGIVTAILNPNNQRSFVGIGFAVPIENAAAAVGIPPH